MTLYFTLLLLSITFIFAETLTTESLDQLNDAITQSGKNIKMKAGEYNLKDISLKKRVITFSGSDNTIDLRGVSVQTTVGLVRHCYILVTGNNNTILGGEFEDIYSDGSGDVKDFGAYNRDKTRAYGLRGDAVMSIHGGDNTVKDIKLTVRGSWPYGYGSYYGIGARNTFGLNKRCGLVIKGKGNTIDGAELQMRAFGHGIYMQNEADKTLIKNCLVEGRVRKTADLYDEKHKDDLPHRSDYYFPNHDDFKMDSPGKFPMPKNTVHSICEDGIRMYNDTGSIIVENCTVKKMRGGIRLYLGGPAVVKKCNVQLCENTAYNLPKGGEVIESRGDFSFSPISDYRLNRNNTKAEWTILRSPQATGNHNIMDLLGNNHHITLNRTKGPLDKKEKRAIVVTGSNSTIINNTEYTIVLEKTAKNNTIQSFGPVKDQGSNNQVKKLNSLLKNKPQ